MSYGTYSFCDISVRGEYCVADGLGSDVFAPIVNDSIAGVFVSIVFVPNRVYPRGGPLFAIVWKSNC